MLQKREPLLDTGSDKRRNKRNETMRRAYLPVLVARYLGAVRAICMPVHACAMEIRDIPVPAPQRNPAIATALSKEKNKSISFGGRSVLDQRSVKRDGHSSCSLVY